MQCEMIFGFLLNDELMKDRPECQEVMANCPLPDGSERRVYEHRVHSAMMVTLSINILHLWGRATYDITPSGPIIGLMTNKESTVTPPTELIKRIQAYLELEVEPKWVYA